MAETKLQHTRIKKRTNKSKQAPRRDLKRLLADLKPQIDVDVERRRPRLVAILFCMFFSTDVLGRSNIVGSFDRIFADPETKQTGQFILLVRTAETREKGVIISFLDPSNRVVAAVVFDEPGQMPTDETMHLQYSHPVSFVATTEGAYWVDVSYQGKSIGGESLNVEFRKSPETEVQV